MAPIGQRGRALLAGPASVADRFARRLLAEDPTASASRDRRRTAIVCAVVAALMALVTSLWMWGFTVDDALISIRYARNLKQGLGYRFNAGGPVTDGVTPLPWPFLLAPMAGADAFTVLARAKAFGLGAWLSAATLLGYRLGGVRAPMWARAIGLASLLVCVPLSAHAVSGMETALAVALACVASCLRREWIVALAAGLAAALRPELLPWSVAVSVGNAVLVGTGGRTALPVLHALRAAAMASFPFFACVAARLVVFGRGAPLALSAKPSDLSHGFMYAVAAAIVCVAPFLVCAPIALARAPRAAMLAAAAVVHLVVVVAVGGDWMPFARLVVPIAPSLILAFVIAAGSMSRVAVAMRAAAALLIGAYVTANAAPPARHVGPEREALAARAAPHIAGKSVACLDIGWVSAATEGTIVDLAGLTDPEIAVLPGGHTSKRIDAAFLVARSPERVLFYVPEGTLGSAPDEALLSTFHELPYGRAVEARLARAPLVAEHFTPEALLPLGSRGAGYVLLRRTR